MVPYAVLSPEKNNKAVNCVTAPARNESRARSSVQVQCGWAEFRNNYRRS